MAEAAEGLIAGTGWLPPLLRTGVSLTADGDVAAPDEVAAEVVGEAPGGAPGEAAGHRDEVGPESAEAAAISDAA